MKEYGIEILEEEKVDKRIIEIVKRSILIAEKFISIPKSTKITPEIVEIVNQVYRKGKK